MPEPVVEIPNRPAFRSSEVCEIAQIPPYVLRSWEKEFPGLGVAPRPGAARVYRRGDVEQVLKIKHLLFNEGLTLAGARRKLDGEPKVGEEPLPAMPLEGDARAKVARIKQELRSLLDMLSAPGSQTPQPDSAPRVEATDVHAPTWPPARPAPSAPSAPVASQPAPNEPAPREPVAEETADVAAAADPPRSEDELPLLDGVPDKPAPAKAARRARRPSSRPPGGS